MNTILQYYTWYYMTNEDIQQVISEAGLEKNNQIDNNVKISDENQINVKNESKSVQGETTTLNQNEEYFRILAQETYNKIQQDIEAKEYEKMNKDPVFVVNNELDSDDELTDSDKSMIKEKMENILSKLKLTPEQSMMLASVEKEYVKNNSKMKEAKINFGSTYMKGWIAEQDGLSGQKFFSDMLNYYQEEHGVPPSIFKEKPLAKQQEAYIAYKQSLFDGKIWKKEEGVDDNAKNIAKMLKGYNKQH